MDTGQSGYPGYHKMGFRPRFKTPLSRARDAALQYALRPFYYFTPRTRAIIGITLLVIVTTILLSRNYWSGFSEEYKEGDVVMRTVISPADITTVDIQETEKRREVRILPRVFAPHGKISKSSQPTTQPVSF
jgi:hypothetical protein